MNERFRSIATKGLAVSALATGFSGAGSIIDSSSDYQYVQRTSEDSMDLEENDGLKRSTYVVDAVMARAGEQSNRGLGLLGVTILLAGAAVELNRRPRPQSEQK